MTTSQSDGEPALEVTRRGALTATGICLAMLSQKALAADVLTPEKVATFVKDAETNEQIEVVGIHDGKGKGKIKFFRFNYAAAPTYFLVYDLEPGASEGGHVHYLDNRNNEGSFDEYYYIISGSGHMEIDGKPVPITAGDHVHTPLEVHHGIENTHPSDNLRVFLTYIKRGTEVYPIKRAPKPADVTAKPRTATPPLP